MHSFLQRILFIICCFSVSYANAQVLPPVFNCLKSDTLIWTPTPNSCGTFESYDIYTASTFDGPYSLLTSIFDPVDIKYFHPNPTDELRFYYLESNHNCPGQIRLKSDTLNNLPPELSKVINLSIIGNNVEIVWEESTSPETIGYIIYRVIGGNPIPIDTVYNDVTYLDVSASPLTQSESYNIVSLDFCGNTSLFGQPQSTTLLNSEVQKCLQRIDFNWIPTANWQDGIAAQEIWIGVDGASPVLVETVDENTNSYMIENLIQGVEYCVFIRAISNVGGYQVITNTVCIEPTIVQPIVDLYFKNIDVQNNDNVEVEWFWNNNAELKSASLNYTLVGGNSTQEVPLNTMPPLAAINRLEIPNAASDLGQWEFGITTTDECDTIKMTGLGSSIFLSIESNGGLSNNCSWTPLIIPNANVQNYEVIRRTNNRSESVGIVDASTFDFTDNLSIDDVTDGDICYTIRATSILTHPDGTEEKIISNSNQVCNKVSAKIFMPNAFAPRGRNQILKPVISFGSPSEYKMLVFNRYGTQVFESNDILSGWNGKYKERDAPMGIYTYLINMVQQDGTSEQIAGTVMLVR